MNNLKPEKIIKYSANEIQILFHFVFGGLMGGLFLSVVKQETFIFFVPLVLVMLVLPIVLFFFRAQKICFYKNKFVAKDEYKYAEFQCVYFTKHKQILLKTENGRQVCSLLEKSNAYSFEICSQILAEFSNRGKEIIIDDIWYGLMPSKNGQKSSKMAWIITIIEFTILFCLFIVFDTMF